jgi:hypothetical protein
MRSIEEFCRLCARDSPDTVGSEKDLLPERNEILSVMVRRFERDPDNPEVCHTDRNENFEEIS